MLFTIYKNAGFSMNFGFSKVTMVLTFLKLYHLIPGVFKTCKKLAPNQSLQSVPKGTPDAMDSAWEHQRKDAPELKHAA